MTIRNLTAAYRMAESRAIAIASKNKWDRRSPCVVCRPPAPDKHNCLYTAGRVPNGIPGSPQPSIPKPLHQSAAERDILSPNRIARIERSQALVNHQTFLTKPQSLSTHPSAHGVEQCAPG
jgi:hypothetical protein